MLPWVVISPQQKLCECKRGFCAPLSLIFCSQNKDGRIHSYVINLSKKCYYGFIPCNYTVRVSILSKTNPVTSAVTFPLAWAPKFLTDKSSTFFKAYYFILHAFHTTKTLLRLVYFLIVLYWCLWSECPLCFAWGSTNREWGTCAWLYHVLTRLRCPP